MKTMKRTLAIGFSLAALVAATVQPALASNAEGGGGSVNCVKFESNPPTYPWTAGWYCHDGNGWYYAG